MAHPSTTPLRTPVGERRAPKGLGATFAGLTRQNAPSQLVAGVTLLAIAIPEQLATSTLAGVAAYTALLAFITATLVFVVAGSNPIVSVGADSTIAPLFAVAMLRLAPANSTLYLELVAAAAVVAGLVVFLIGVLRLGWIADFLSLPIVTGFLGGIGVIIIVHQLPSALGLAGGGTSVIQRLQALSHQLGSTSGWSVGLAVATLLVLLVGEKINSRIPWALVGIVVATILSARLTLINHGVKELGTVSAHLPQWHLHWLSASQWGVVVTTAVTLVVVIVSQTAATSRTIADEMGIAADISRDFAGVGLANVAAGLVGTFPVNASPARTTVTNLAGGRTKLVGLTAAALAIALSPFSHYAHMIPLAALAGVLWFIASRLIKVGQLRRVFRASKVEFFFAAVSMVGVIFVGVEQGLAIAVGLAIIDQTWRSARPHLIALGRRPGTTSWEPLTSEVAGVDHVVAALFDNDLFFANAGVFRREVHELLATFPGARHLVIDAVACADVDFTGVEALTQVVDDLAKEHVTLSLARANDRVKHALALSTSATVRSLSYYDNVDLAVEAATATKLA